MAAPVTGCNEKNRRVVASGQADFVGQAVRKRTAKSRWGRPGNEQAHSAGCHTCFSFARKLACSYFKFLAETSLFAFPPSFAGKGPGPMALVGGVGAKSPHKAAEAPENPTQKRTEHSPCVL